MRFTIKLRQKCRRCGTSYCNPVHIGNHKYIKNINKHNSTSYVFVCLSTKSVQAIYFPPPLSVLSFLTAALSRQP